MTDENANTSDLTDSEKLDAILRRLEALETLVEERLKDTRPLWQGINQRTERIEQEMREVRKDLRSIDRTFGTFSADHLRMRADIQDFNERLMEMERRPN